MAEMDVLQSKIIQQIEVYLTEDNLKNDYNLAKYEREYNGWIPVERLNQFNKLSTYKYDTILNALRSKRSNIIELNFCHPISLRRRRHPLPGPNVNPPNGNLHRTVVINGLPRDAQLKELMEYFNGYYPVDQIKMLSSLHMLNHSFTGKIHVIFEKDQDALEFVRRSEVMTMIYVNDYVLQLCNGYTLVCRMLADCDDQDEKDLIHHTERFRFDHGKVSSSRLANDSPRVSFSTNISVAKDDHVRPKPLPIPTQTKSCLKSNTCATEQILFCQNTNDKKLSKAVEYQTQGIVKNCFSYQFYMPDHLLKQTHECMIVAALNPHCLTIQLKQDALEFDKFQREMNEFYNEINDQQYFVTPERIRLNLCVICADPKCSDNDQIWNRSQILDYDPSDQTVNLFYVDLGTWDEYVPINRLRYLIDDFHRHLVFSLTCCLAHISPVNDQPNNSVWPLDATAQFLAVIGQALPEVELLSLEQDGCFQINLFVVNSGQFVCVNDYMIHIKQAKAKGYSIRMENLSQTKVVSIHPVIALYNRLGETLKQSLVECRSITPNQSVCNATKALVKLIHVDRFTRQVPLVFVYHDRSILMPDFNIYTLLETNNSNIVINIIEDYAVAIRYESIHLTRTSHIDVFTQLQTLLNAQSSNSIRLYTIDFVQCILEYHHCSLPNVNLALESAKLAQLYAVDLALWFTIDNELIATSDMSMKSNEHNSIGTDDRTSLNKRLAFSNRLISPI